MHINEPLRSVWEVKLISIIDERFLNRLESSYTAKLFNSGINRIAQKVGEEGLETALAAVAESNDKLKEEAADLLYHLLVLLRAKDIKLDDAINVLISREKE